MPLILLSLLANQTCVSVDLTSPDMHDGDGMMREEIERVRKRAEAASS